MIFLQIQAEAGLRRSVLGGAGWLGCWGPPLPGFAKKIKNASSSGYQDLMGHLILTTSSWSILTWITLLSRLLTWLTCSSYLCLLFKLMGVVLGKFYHHFQNTSTFWLDWNWLERKFVFFKEKCCVSAKKQHNTNPSSNLNLELLSRLSRDEGKGWKNRRLW